MTDNGGCDDDDDDDDDDGDDGDDDGSGGAVSSIDNLMTWVEWEWMMAYAECNAWWSLYPETSVIVLYYDIWLLNMNVR